MRENLYLSGILEAFRFVGITLNTILSVPVAFDADLFSILLQHLNSSSSLQYLCNK